ncbi:MAG: 50S ribosomal protein L29 [Rikenellaceae bacterium]|nr:50S ribosomal protein L29 [Rikenellaceae bacterium]
MKTSEIKELSVAEIQERIDAEKENLSRLKLNHTVSPIENSSEIKKSRRDIARMLTILRQKNSNI